MARNEVNAMAQDSLLEFPCRFPIKAFGRDSEAFEAAVHGIIETHVPAGDRERFQRRPSRRGRYSAITVTITATSQDQIDAIYRALSAHELVLMAL